MQICPGGCGASGMRKDCTLFVKDELCRVIIPWVSSRLGAGRLVQRWWGLGSGLALSSGQCCGGWVLWGLVQGQEGSGAGRMVSVWC